MSTRKTSGFFHVLPFGKSQSISRRLIPVLRASLPRAFLRPSWSWWNARGFRNLIILNRLHDCGLQINTKRAHKDYLMDLCKKGKIIPVSVSQAEQFNTAVPLHLRTILLGTTASCERVWASPRPLLREVCWPLASLSVSAPERKEKRKS